MPAVPPSAPFPLAQESSGSGSLSCATDERCASIVKMYEVVNPNLHIIFTELPGNVYLIIGVAATGKGYREIPYRLANGENRQNIAEIIEAIKDVKIKRKYLAEQNSKIPSFTDKRIRK